MKLKTIIAVIISILPNQTLRRILYKLILNYNISKKSYIGFLCIIISDNCNIENSNINSINFIFSKKIEIKNSNINRFNRFKNIQLVKVFCCNIGKLNKFYGNKKITINSSILIGKNSEIRNFNYFDLNGQIVIKENVFINSHCSFWTHAFDDTRSKIIIGDINIDDNVKIETASTLIHSIKIASNVLIEFGTIVSKSIIEEGKYNSNELYRKD